MRKLVLIISISCFTMTLHSQSFNSQKFNSNDPNLYIMGSYIDYDVVPVHEDAMPAMNSNNTDRNLSDTLTYIPADGGWNGMFIQSPGDAMLVMYQMPADGIIKGVNVPVYAWGTGDQQMTISLHAVSYPMTADGTAYPSTAVNSDGWIGGYDMDANGHMTISGTTYSAGGTESICNTGMQVVAGAQDPLGTTDGTGPAGLPTKGLLWPDGFTSASLIQVSNPAQQDNWINTEDYGTAPELEAGQWVGILIQSTGVGGGDDDATGFYYEDGDGVVDPWVFAKFYHECSGTSGNGGWHIRQHIVHAQLAVELTGDRGPQFGSISQLGVTTSTENRLVTAHVTDDNPTGEAAGVSAVTLNYQLDSLSATVNSVSLSLSAGTSEDGTWSGQIPGVPTGHTVYWSLTAYDNNGNATTSNNFYYFVVSSGWVESFNTDATTGADLLLTSDMTWSWWGWGSAEVDSGSLELVGAADPFGNNTSWIQIDQSIDSDVIITPELAEIYIKTKFTTSAATPTNDWLSIMVAIDPSFLSNLQLYGVVSTPNSVGGYIGEFYYGDNSSITTSSGNIYYDEWFWQKITIEGNEVSVWTYPDGGIPSEDADYTFTTDYVTDPVASLIIVATTNGDLSKVLIDEIYYNSIPSSIPQPPEANAGEDQIVSVGDSVVISGILSGGGYLTYSWSQIGGDETVTLSNPTGITTAFTAPSTVDELVFELTVTNTEMNESDSDTVTVTVTNPTDVSGSVSGHWTLDESPRIVQGNLVIQPDDTLIIDPGVEVLFNGNYRMDIFGTLFAVGTETDSIIFSTNYSAGWMSLNFADMSNDSSKLQYCIIEYASSSGYDPYLGAINCHNSSPAISNSIFEYNDKVIYISGSSTNVFISDNKFQNNNTAVFLIDSAQANINENIIVVNDYGIEMQSYSQAVIHDNIISGINNSAIMLENDCMCTANISDNVITNNINDGIYMHNSGFSNIINNTISHNGGRGIFFQNNSNLNIHNNIISNNDREGIDFVGSNYDFTLTNNTISYNGLNNASYGLHISGCYGEIISNKIVGNHNGIYIENVSGGDVEIRNNTVYDNVYYGLHWSSNNPDSNTLTAENNSITNNQTGIYCSNGGSFNTISYNNCWNNSSTNYGGSLPTGTGNLTNINANFTVCDIYYNISENPQYVNADSADFNLQQGSPNIDAGDPNSPLDPDTSIADIGALPSPYGSTIESLAIIDIGSDSVDFGSALIGDSIGLSLIIQNTGNVDLTITNISSSVSEFEIGIDTLVVSPSSEGGIPILFRPTAFGLVTANLTISSDAFNTPELVVTLIGSGDLPPQPDILSVDDIPDDQGGQVRVTFSRSKFDGIDDTQELESYTVWRQIEGTEWDAVGMFNAVQDSFYYYVAPTLCDSTHEDICLSTYKVSAHTDDADVFFWSDSMSGYSIDNIAPGVPTGLMANSSEAGIQLTWNMNPEEDFQYYNLDKSLTEDFSDFQTIETSDTTYLDSEYEIDVTVYYRLSAFDHAGNQSEYSEVLDATVLWTDLGIAIPDEFAIHQNYPNPFNPVTTLRYDLPEQTYVNIIIYDMLGRKIRTLINEQQDPGYKSLIWNATNDYGKPVSAGIYLYQIQAGEYISTKKMVLLK